jgi:hypothetical protein
MTDEDAVSDIVTSTGLVWRHSGTATQNNANMTMDRVWQNAVRWLNYHRLNTTYIQGHHLASVTMTGGG